LKKWNKLGPEGLHPGDQIFVSPPPAPPKTKMVQAAPKPAPVSFPVKHDSVQSTASTVNIPIIVPSKEISPANKPGESSPVAVKDSSKTATAINKNSPYVFAKGRKEISEQGVASWIEDEEVNANKYYALHRTAPKGTIIRITNRMNQKSVFVKVIGVLPETGDNEGLIIKVSKASADKLGVLDKKFQADLVYGL